jgi:hypothetical protein
MLAILAAPQNPLNKLCWWHMYHGSAAYLLLANFAKKEKLNTENSKLK